jgi:hypothetical protein
VTQPQESDGDGRAHSQRDVREHACMVLGHSWLAPTDPENPRFECVRCGVSIRAEAATRVHTVTAQERRKLS